MLGIGTLPAMAGSRTEGPMTYVVTDNCIKCKYMDCVEVCPVDCFYEGENMLVIHPDECIDCGVCEPECPAEAIKPDTEPSLETWLKVNADYARTWPNITQKKDAPGRRQDVGRRRRQVRGALLSQSRHRRLIAATCVRRGHRTDTEPLATHRRRGCGGLASVRHAHDARLPAIL